jgi:spoIIIJ-associated protein
VNETQQTSVAAGESGAPDASVTDGDVREEQSGAGHGTGAPAVNSGDPDAGKGETKAAPDDVDEADDADDTDDTDEAGGPEAVRQSGRRAGRGGPSGGESLRRLEEEGEVAADYLEELLDIVDLDGDIDIDVENGRASVAIVAEAGGQRELRRLVGAQGEVLEALQELSRLAVQARTGDRSRLMLDVAGFRAARRRALEDLAARICQEVQRSGEAVKLEPMTAFERKVVHDVVAGAGLISESEGEEPGRRVVVHPAVT